MISMNAIIKRNICNVLIRTYSVKITANNDKDSAPIESENFQTVFRLPLIKNIARFQRIKIYQMAASAIAIPGCGILEMLNILPDNSTLATSYIGVTGIILLCLGSIPTTNAIGFLYISDDEKKIKISSVDFWGRRINRIIDTNDWIPMSDMPNKNTDFLYLSPQLEDGTKYKLFVRYGQILNRPKMGRVLE